MRFACTLRKCLSALVGGNSEPSNVKRHGAERATARHSPHLGRSPGRLAFHGTPSRTGSSEASARAVKFVGWPWQEEGDNEILFFGPGLGA